MTNMINTNALKIVEKTLSTIPQYPSNDKLWNILSKQMSRFEFNAILNHLEKSNKIIYDKNEIVWISTDNPKLVNLLKTSKTLV